MNIIKINQTKTAVTYNLEGRLDTTTAPLLETELKAVPDNITELVLNFKTLDYISSAGLRVLLVIHKIMIRRGGSLVITGANEVVKEIFEVTGFSDILTIK